MEAKALRCPGCGAPVPPDAPQCPYCQAQLATVACPACFAMVPLSADHCPSCGAAMASRVPAVADGAPCPACGKPLGAGQVGGLETQPCLACGGLWLDRAVFEQLGTSRERQGSALGALPAPAIPPVVPGQVQYRPCPACGQRMNRVNYARQSGVVLDVCKAHGLWFDRDELRRVLAFIAGGGLDRARERELEDLKEARRAAAQARPQEASGLDLESQAGVHPGWLTAAGLVGLAMEVADHLLHRD